MKTRLQRQRTTTPDRSEGDRTNSNGSTAVQAQTEESLAQPIDLQMQRASEMGHSLGGFTIQPDLAIGQPGDKYEQEADEIAGQAVQMKAQPGSTNGSSGKHPDGKTTEPSTVQHKVDSTVQRQPDLDVGGSMPDMGGGDMGGMADAIGGGGDLSSAAGDLGGSGGDLGGMADAMSGGGDLGDLGGMADAMGGGGDLGDLGGMGDMAEAMDDGDLLGEVPDNPEGTDASEALEPEEGEDPIDDMLEVGEIMEGSGLGDSFGEEGLEGGIRKEIIAGGQPLPDEIQEMLSSRLGMANPEDIRIHDNTVAHDLCDQMGALAFTTGNHIFFAAGEYDPGSTDGQELIFHEAVHTIQQGAIDGSEGAAEEEAETNEAVAMQEDANNGGDKSADQSSNTENQEGGDTETDGAETDGQQAANEVEPSPEAEKATEGAGEEAKTEADTPPEVVGQIKGFLGKPPTPVEPANVSEPSMSETAPTVDGSSVPDLADNGSDLVGGGGDGGFDLAVAEVMNFAGTGGGDILNLQAAEETKYDVASGQIKSDNAAGEWIANNMILANTTGKVMEIGNRWGDVGNLPNYHKYNPLYYAALAVETVVMVLEIISGILDVISLILLTLMIGLYLIAGFFYAIGLLLNLIPPGGWGAWAISLATTIAAFTNTNFPPIFNFLDTVLVMLALARIPLRLIVMALWLLEGITSAIVLACMGRHDDALDALTDGAALAGNQVIGLVGDVIEIVAFNLTSQGDTIATREVLDAANPMNLKTTYKSLGDDLIMSKNMAFGNTGSNRIQYNIVGLRDATGAEIWDTAGASAFKNNVDLGDNVAVKNAIVWGDEGVKEVLIETGIDAGEGYVISPWLEYGQDQYKGVAKSDAEFKKDNKSTDAIWGQAKTEANSQLQSKAEVQNKAAIQKEDDDADMGDDGSESDLVTEALSTIEELPELDLGDEEPEDSATNHLMNAIMAAAVAEMGIAELEALAMYNEEKLEGLYYTELVLAERGAFAETAEGMSTASLEQNKEAEGMLGDSSGDVAEAQDDAGDMTGAGKTLNSIFGPLVSGAGAFMPIDSSGQEAVNQSVDSGETSEEAVANAPGSVNDSGKDIDESNKTKENIIGDAQKSQGLVANEEGELGTEQATAESDLADTYSALPEMYGLRDEAASAIDEAADEQAAEMEEASAWAETVLSIIEGYWAENEPEEEEEDEEEGEDDDNISWEEIHEIFVNLSYTAAMEAQAAAGGE